VGVRLEHGEDDHQPDDVDDARERTLSSLRPAHAGITVSCGYPTFGRMCRVLFQRTATVLKIDETTRPDGSLAPVLIRSDDEGLSVSCDQGTLALPQGALEAVMKRYGMPLDASARIAEIASLEVGEGASLRHVRHLGRFDVIARDYLVFSRPDEDPLCALAKPVAGALVHLGTSLLRMKR
jgi:hypothetical protein